MVISFEVERVGKGFRILNARKVVIMDVPDGDLFDYIEGEFDHVESIARSREARHFHDEAYGISEGKKLVKVTPSEYRWSKFVCVRPGPKCVLRFEGKWCLGNSSCEFKEKIKW